MNKFYKNIDRGFKTGDKIYITKNCFLLDLRYLRIPDDICKLILKERYGVIYNKSFFNLRPSVQRRFNHNLVYLKFPYVKRNPIIFITENLLNLDVNKIHHPLTGIFK